MDESYNKSFLMDTLKCLLTFPLFIFEIKFLPLAHTHSFSPVSGVLKSTTSIEDDMTTYHCSCWKATPKSATPMMFQQFLHPSNALNRKTRANQMYWIQSLLLNDRNSSRSTSFLSSYIRILILIFWSRWSTC